MQFDIWRNRTESKLPDSFTFIDLFAGIGGFRLGMEELRGKCVFSCERDKFCQQTYAAWFGEAPFGDIRDLDSVSNIQRVVPEHDILTAGFPCQPFSIAGVSKKKSLGRMHGFDDQDQGNLFFSILRIMRVLRPPIAILENVKNLKSHDRGRTWHVIKSSLESINYEVYSDVLDARHWVPQHRERIFIVCFDKARYPKISEFAFPNVEDIASGPKFRDILESYPDSKYTLSDRLWIYLKDYARKHREKGNGFGYGLTDSDGISRTLSARYYKDGSEVLISQGVDRNPRRLTPREAARLMGFPDSLPIVVSDTQAYKQFGNAVVPAVVSAVGGCALRKKTELEETRSSLASNYRKTQFRSRASHDN